MKRVLCILNNMNVGGAETFLMKIYRAIDKDLYQMDFCLGSSFKSYYEDEIIGYGGKVFHITSKSENIKKFKKELFDVVKNNNYEYVLKITANSMGIMDLKICKKAGAKRCCVRSSNSSDQGGVKIKILNALGKLLYLRYADVLIAPSKLAAKYTFGRTNAVNYLHNGIDFEQYKYNEEKRNNIRNLHNIPNDYIVFGHIGRFDKQKNHKFMIEIFSEYHLHHPNSVLMLVGNGELADECKKISIDLGINNSVLFCGQNQNISDYLSAMDVFMLPSLYEGMPNTLIEAQANGLPCLVSSTITTEANITNNCCFISLKKEKWISVLNNSNHLRRIDSFEAFKKSGYLIQNSLDNFVQIIFGEENATK